MTALEELAAENEDVQGFRAMGNRFYSDAKHLGIILWIGV